MDGTMELAAKIAAYSPLALKLSKEAVKSAADSPEYQSLHRANELVLKLLASAEYKERIAAFLAKGKG
jgi:enoyl-CoA hydratase/carnithine racemase